MTHNIVLILAFIMLFLFASPVQANASPITQTVSGRQYEQLAPAEITAFNHVKPLRLQERELHVAPLFTETLRMEPMNRATYELSSLTPLFTEHSTGKLHSDTLATLRHTSLVTTTCTVTAADDSGTGSLRQCLHNAGPGTTIDFDMQVFPPTSPVTIALQTPLPWIVTDTLTIDGSNVGVVLDGSSMEEGHGLVITGTTGVAIQGLQILNFPQFGITLAGSSSNCTIGGDRSLGAAPLGQGNLISGNGLSGVLIRDKGTEENILLGNSIGIDASGTQTLPNTHAGILISNEASRNTVGGVTPNTHNLISGNTTAGVLLQGEGTDQNRVVGNYIGTNATGSQDLPNGQDGVLIGFGASENQIGGEASSERNLISGNTLSGIFLQNGGTDNNMILGNYVGTNITGTQALPNGESGITISFGASRNQVGGDKLGAGNLISGNIQEGILISREGTVENVIVGNYIGTDASGTRVLPNGFSGVGIGFGASRNQVGGNTSGTRNLISGNTSAGVIIQGEGTDENVIVGNHIGTNITGTQALPNEAGIIIGLGANSNRVGGETLGARNLISGNSNPGVFFQDEGTDENWLLGNHIGTDVTGTQALPNGEAGIIIGLGASSNRVGGETPGAGNLISGNSGLGVILQNQGTEMNIVMGNYIGTDVTGTQALPNKTFGVSVGFGATNNKVGGAKPDAGNLISGNMLSGVVLQNEGTTENQIIGNHIGTDASGTQALPNGQAGVGIALGARQNIVGGQTPDERNFISGNMFSGVVLQGTEENVVLGNYIGTDTSGTQALPNGEVGVLIALGASSNRVGGMTLSERNLISGNTLEGVFFQNQGTEQNEVFGNYIGTDASGTQSLPNGLDGIGIGFGASENKLGGEPSGAGNLISGNSRAGILIGGEDTNRNVVMGNYIGIDMSGTQVIPNAGVGIGIISGASANIIGGETPGAGNLISGNTDSGIVIDDEDTVENVVTGNYIGTNLTVTATLPNNGHGVYLVDGASFNTIGISNVIAYNSKAGVAIEGERTQGNLITRNVIHSNADNPIVYFDHPSVVGTTPVIHRYNEGDRTLTGHTCSRCRIEVYANPNPDPAGHIYLGAVDADPQGDFRFTLDSPPPLPYLAVTSVDINRETSEFSIGFDTIQPNHPIHFFPFIVR